MIMNAVLVLFDSLVLFLGLKQLQTSKRKIISETSPSLLIFVVVVIIIHFPNPHQPHPIVWSLGHLVVFHPE